MAGFGTKSQYLATRILNGRFTKIPLYQKGVPILKDTIQTSTWYSNLCNQRGLNAQMHLTKLQTLLISLIIMGSSFSVKDRDGVFFARQLQQKRRLIELHFEIKCKYYIFINPPPL